MKSRNIKTRLAAFGLALLMGLSPLGNLADVHAAESEISQNAVTEKESKTESDHPVSEISEQTVTAEDITKDVSDKEFMAETCMEGIQYDPEKEDVTLERIEARMAVRIIQTRQGLMSQRTGLCQKMSVTATLLPVRLF